MKNFLKNILHDLKRNSAVLSYGQNCIVWIGAYTDTGNGHKHVTWPDGQKSTEKAHRLAYVAHSTILRDKLPKHNELGLALDVSHMCHNKKSINIEHLILEPHYVNLDRNSCFSDGFCSKRHEPYCIL